MLLNEVAGNGGNRIKILLINPSVLAESGRDLYSAHLMGPLYTGRPNTRMALGIPLALPTLAALTPPEHPVKIVDEEVEEIDFDEKFDLVGITAMTFKARRAYEIASEFRKRGITVVMGGVHATVCPDEALTHVDTIVIGEAEDVWAALLSDAEAGTLRQVYQARERLDLKVSPIPRYGLVRNEHYLFAYLQTARGCPFNCRFCSVTKVAGHIVRKKTAEQVIAEVDAVLRLNRVRPITVIDTASGRKKKLVGLIAFIDDNFAIDRKHALSVCDALCRYQEDRGIAFTWYTQVNYMVGFDEELLSAMARANCRYLFIGFENLDPEALRSMNKKMNDPERYGEAIANIHRHQMLVVFSTIIGDDNPSPRSATLLKSFLRRNHVVHVLLNIMTPFPGTDLAAEMERDGRILTKEPQLYNIRNVVFTPRGLSVSQLVDLYLSLCNSIFSYTSVFERGKGLLIPMSRFRLPFFFRPPVLFTFMYVCLVFALRRKLRWPVAARMLLSAPRPILLNGSLYALELLIASADYDDFLQSEARRIGTLRERREPLKSLVESKIENYTRPFEEIRGGKVGRRDGRIPYRAFYVTRDDLKSLGVEVAPEDVGRPILLLGGTSVPISDRMGFIEHLLAAGYEVTSIENPIGSPLDFHINPGVDRARTLRYFIDHLAKERRITTFDIIAQSYSAFETVRVLMANPSLCRLVGSIILINPPGLNERITFSSHVIRFLTRHLAGGYLKSLASLLGVATAAPREGTRREKRVHARKEAEGITVWMARTVINLVRTFREVQDIVTFRIKEPIRNLQNQHGCDINIFLQSDDQVVPAQITEAALKDILPPGHIRIVPGGHIDLFFQEWQRDEFMAFLREIRSRQNSSERFSRSE